MKVVTANRPSDGVAVWLAADHSWTRTIEDAEVAFDEVTEEKLERAGRAALLKKEVVDLDTVDVELVGGHVRPLPCAA